MRKFVLPAVCALLLTLTACKSTDIGESVKNINIGRLFGSIEPVKLEFSLTGGDAAGRMTPGDAVELEVVLTEEDGKTHRLSKDDFDMDDLTIEGDYFSVIENTRKLSLKDEISGMGRSPYRIAVQYKDFVKQRVVRDFPADYAKIYGPHPEDVEKFEVTLDRAGASGVLAPGRPVLLVVTAVSRDGRTFSLNGGGLKLPPARLDVRTENMQWRQSGGELVPEADKNRMQGRDYAVEVAYRGNPSLKRTLNFKADYALLFGPQPAQVASLALEVSGNADGAYLLPGKSYPFTLVVTDKKGRVYSTDGKGDGDLPLDRVTLSGRNISFNPSETSFRTIDDRAAMRGAGFEMVVAYKGRSEIRARARFRADFALLAGPDPEQVKRFELLGEILQIKKAEPGRVIMLNAAVIDDRGRRFETRVAKLPFPRDKLRVEGENVAYDPASGELKLDSSYRRMAGRQFKLTAWYAGRKDLAVSHTIVPELTAKLPLMTQNTITLAGPNGPIGNNGRRGNPGSYGGPNPRAQAGNGNAGTPGGNGTPGRQGQRGPNLRIIAQEVRTLDGKTRLVLIELRAPSLEPKYFMRTLDGPPLSITSYGGKGGNGGRGGDGGSGGKGLFGGSGGSGGRGGDGTSGGQGGDGGNIELILANPDLERAFVLDAPGGGGGKGGAGGNGGSGGIGGAPDYSVPNRQAASQTIQMLSALTQKRQYQPQQYRGPQPRPGNDGSGGAPGNFGADGSQGRQGTINVSVNRSAFDVARRAPKDLTERVLF